MVYPKTIPKEFMKEKKPKEDCPMYSCHLLPCFKFVKNKKDCIEIRQFGSNYSCSLFYCDYPEINCKARRLV